jgi:tRNA(Ile2) C34 agmatinyltransferase TiaS
MIIVDIIGITILLLVFIGMIVLAIWLSTICPRCGKRLESHPQFSNADYCKNCKYIKVND